MLVPDQPPVSRRRKIIGLATTALVLTGAGVLAWTENPSATERNGVYTCVTDGSQTEEEKATTLGLCYGEAMDKINRKPLPSPASNDLAAASRVWRALLDAICTPGVGDFICRAPRPATEADVDMVRQELHDQGFPDALVRLARPNDPAPPGAIMYAVTLPSGACIATYAEMGGEGPHSAGISGPLLDGRCLTP
ncbi:hypothetical protein Aca07nite_39030 [Actinoplanes capillaceus]|uniref:Uncharacterized protein n=1 Tax=Actinoplanes campanulatus TaxID=113559 RepID=A0ABQ3WK65_9ACTN|nr:hypothetical protein [Actinoplanes capillaceus]GID46628.1 hypothetical protein Aca07nite_39030 [Actinoplanes capillaceus]